MTYVKRIKKERSVNLYLLSSNEGLKFYAYVVIPHKNYEKFEEEVALNKFNFPEYALIVDFGIGVNTPGMAKAKEVEDFIRLLET